jgi:hypothetical protein
VTILDEVDQLYELAVMSPASLNDQMIQDWSEGVVGGYEMDRLGAKYVRRCVSIASRLATFWAARKPAQDDPVGWPSRVDLALGIRAWRPQMELAQHLLETSPDEATYDRAAELFRIVNSEPFLDGMSYEGWCETCRP